jgi:hypothetical protein
MTSGTSATNSAAYLRKWSATPAAQRTSIRTLRPSTHPNCCSPCTNAVSRACPSGSSAIRFSNTPMRRIRSGCCARAADGHAAAAPPSSVMNSPPHVEHGGSLPGAAADHTSSAPPGRRLFDASGACRGTGQPVRGADLNRSEMSCVFSLPARSADSSAISARTPYSGGNPDKANRGGAAKLPYHPQHPRAGSSVRFANAADDAHLCASFRLYQVSLSFFLAAL